MLAMNSMPICQRSSFKHLANKQRVFTDITRHHQRRACPAGSTQGTGTSTGQANYPNHVLQKHDVRVSKDFFHKVANPPGVLDDTRGDMLAMNPMPEPTACMSCTTKNRIMQCSINANQ
jgi:hypothetical protein